MQDFEKLGVFYLGKEYDMEKGQSEEELVLYKSKDLTTHAVIIGMTGSGKTGLGISILEEAAIDNIPIIAIDPKGDLGNLALTFPELKGEDFRPWVNQNEAQNKGISVDEYAQAQADMWRKGLADWGQDGKRIEKLRNSAGVTIYTPGGTAGIGVSVLKSFSAPSTQVINDYEAFRDRILVTVSGLLSLVGIDADPLTSREHILISNILEQAWRGGQNLGLADIINYVQKPPIDKIGVMDIEGFFPSKDRFALAIRLNNLLASPGFKTWMEGEALDTNRFLYDETGRPRISIFSIAHLGDSERMFFVTMLLNEVLTWARSQPGTGSLRAILYMDEMFGYLPPTANPPSKTPLLTLLKQARAFGLGLVLSTQNPVDLDYKALSNAGTWFIGRLQTERDKERVLAGLEGAAAGGNFDRKRTEQILAGLGQRLFYLHSVHEDNPVIFSTRWVLSYLAGPLTRDQISALPSKAVIRKIPEIAQNQPNTVAEPAKIAATESQTTDQVKSTQENDLKGAQPVLASQIQQVYLPMAGSYTGEIVYMPSVIGVADAMYSGGKSGGDVSKSYILTTPIHDGPVAIDWKESKTVGIDIHSLEKSPVEGAAYGNVPTAAGNSRSYDSWNTLLKQYIRTDLKLKLLSSPTLKVLSDPSEDERNFRIRLQHLAHERRDADIEDMKKKYSSKINVLEDRQLRARQAVEKQSSVSSQKKADAVVSAGSAILGALFGRKKISASSISKVGTAFKSTNRAMKSGEAIERAKETLESVEEQLNELELELEEQVEKITQKYNMENEKFEEIEISAASSNIAIHMVGLVWAPYRKDLNGELAPFWIDG